ncbi:hypothetical protein EWM64_g393 [Hericium alpestre]|uniref:F-box domain-containing protein n=1 Tax=Hericium alpestre TaxID=135208 RepID=A0A4Z0ABA3_9AGAM|nr:hypothetical protein EWM64_g393 [Hericium alpestre]
MIGLLQTMPFLQDLTLTHWIAAYNEDSSLMNPYPTNAVLSQLRSLKFTTKTVVQSSLFMRRLSLPQTTYIHLHCAYEGFREIPLYLPQMQLDGSDPLPFTRLKVVYTLMGVRIHGSPSVIDDPCGSFTLDMMDMTLRIWIGTTSLLHPLSLQSVTALMLDTCGFFVDCSPVLAFLHTVETIEILFSPLGFLSSPLGSFASSLVVPHAEDGRQCIQMLCPCLRRLEFTTRYRDTVDPAFFGTLAAVLDTRSEAGSPLEEAVVQGECVRSKELRSVDEMKQRKVWKFMKQ